MENNYNLSSVILVNTQMYVQKTGEREQWREAMRMLITIYLPLPTVMGTEHHTNQN